MPDDGYEAFATEYRPENLFGIDKAALWSALLRPKLVVLFAQDRIGQGLIRDGDLLEPLLCVWIVRILVRMKLDRKSACQPGIEYKTIAE